MSLQSTLLLQQHTSPTLFLCVVFVAWNLFRVSSFNALPLTMFSNAGTGRNQCRACRVHVLNSVVTMFMNRSMIINYIVLTESDVQVRIVALSWSKTPGAPHNNPRSELDLPPLALARP